MLSHHHKEPPKIVLDLVILLTEAPTLGFPIQVVIRVVGAEGFGDCGLWVLVGFGFVRVVFGFSVSGFGVVVRVEEAESFRD